LAILEKIGGITTAKCMQKYLFIFARQQSGERIFDFLPHKYGCFSFVANNDIYALQNQGFLKIESIPHQESKYSLSHDLGIFNQLDIFEQQEIRDLVEKFGSLSQDELIAYTYRRWPFSAINSIIKDELLTQAELKRIDAEREKYINEKSALLSLGYEGISIDKYMVLLVQNGVKLLCDVRKNAYSQKYGFTKSILQKACEAVHIQYKHFPELGIESNKRQSLKSQEDYDTLFDEYEQTTLKENQEHIIKLRNLISEHGRICLLCFERDPKQCHRTRIANAVMRLPDVNFNYTPIFV